MQKQIWRFSLLTVLLFLSMQLVSAQVRPAMAVYAVWTPDEQLTSVTVPSLDERFVDLQIYAQGNVPFWAVNLSCTVGSTTNLEFVSLTFAQEWGTAGTDFYHSPQLPTELYTGTGLLAFTATRLGATNSQLGRNGQDYTQLIATARFKVKTLAVNAKAAATCTVMDFIDRNGNIAIKGRQTRFNDLQIYVGYTLTGTVLRQGSRAHQNIEVTCGLVNDFINTDQTVFTAANGSFRFGGSTNSATALRHFGLYRCVFESQFVQGSPNSQILQGYVDFDLNTANYNLLPVILRSGDSNNSDLIDFNDVINVASGNSSTVPPFTGNDMNGDGRIDRLDIVFPAGNMGLSDTGDDNSPLPSGFLSDHVIYGIGRDLDRAFTYPNSRIWLGNSVSGDVSLMNLRGTTRDFWPQLSPDGTQVAHISQDARTGRHQLATILVSTGASTLVRFPATFTDHAFAPAWSPDGNRIAFICSPDGGNAVNVGFRYNRGDICIINTADRTGAQINRLNVQSRIFPPTWLTFDASADAGIQAGFVLLYAGVDGDIHYYDFVSSTHGVLAFDAGTVAAADVVDMPVVVNYAYNDETYLAYRYNDNDGSHDPHIRIATIDYSSSGGFTEGVVGVLDADHVSLSSSTTGVDFYDVSAGLDILFYREYNFSKANFPSQDPFLFLTLPHNDASALTWLGAIEHLPDSSVAHPINVADSSSTYNPTASTNPTFLHVWRMSFDYIP